jgi:phosphatidylglycerol:prolipoprotein diacylglycerol transferase
VAFVCLYVVLPRKRYDGQVFVASLILYSAARFLVEILRRDARGGAIGLSTSQLIGLGLIVAAIVIHRVRGMRSAPPRAHAP